MSWEWGERHDGCRIVTAAVAHTNGAAGAYCHNAAGREMRRGCEGSNCC